MESTLGIHEEIHQLGILCFGIVAFLRADLRLICMRSRLRVLRSVLLQPYVAYVSSS